MKEKRMLHYMQSRDRMRATYLYVWKKIIFSFK